MDLRPASGHVGHVVYILETHGCRKHRKHIASSLFSPVSHQRSFQVATTVFTKLI